MTAKKKMEDMVAEKPHLKEINLQNVVQKNNDNSAGDPILPAIPGMIKFTYRFIQQKSRLLYVVMAVLLI